MIRTVWSGSGDRCTGLWRPAGDLAHSYSHHAPSPLSQTRRGHSDRYLITSLFAASHARRRLFRTLVQKKPGPVRYFQITSTHTHTHTHPFNGPLSGTTQVSRYQKGKTNLDLLKQETVSGSGISWAICKFASRSRQITTPAPNLSVLYRPDALPATQPTVSKHWRQKFQDMLDNIRCKRLLSN